TSIDYFDDSTEPPSFLHLWQPKVTASDTVKHTWMHAGAVDPFGDVWLGMDTPGKGEIAPIGLDHYQYAGSSIGFLENFNQSNSAMHGSIIDALSASSNGRLWIGYSGQGIDALDLTTR